MTVMELPALSEAERKVGRLMLTGFTINEIARKLSIGDVTVMIHRYYLCQKLRVRSRKGLRKYRHLLED